jgi:membrane-bound lytic murein transglycosylase B
MGFRGATKRWGIALAICAAFLVASCQGSARAMEDPGKTAGNEPLSEKPFQEWLNQLREEARGKGISEATLEAALRDVVPDMRVIELDRRQPEFLQTFWTYLRQRVSDERIRRGQGLLARHRDLLDKLHAQYGVPPRYLIAFWGLETNFGDRLGDFRVIDALATLAYDQRRAPFFRTQLLYALQILDEGHVSPDAMTGSWAGAMGHMQFIPSTFIGHAVDHTGDGRKDIWSSLPDALSSAANFLSSLGWHPGESWGREVQLPGDFDLTLAGLDTRKAPAEWSALGVRRPGGSALPEAGTRGSILLPQGYRGPAFLVYENFRVIMRWNRAVHYAISVGHLADRIAGLPPIVNGRDAEHKPLSREEIEELQQHLNRFGFDAGEADGLPGSRTQAAIRGFQKEHSLPPDGYPSPDLLKRLRAMAAALAG